MAKIFHSFILPPHSSYMRGVLLVHSNGMLIWYNILKRLLAYGSYIMWIFFPFIKIKLCSHTWSYFFFIIFIFTHIASTQARAQILWVFFPSSSSSLWRCSYFCTRTHQQGSDVLEGSQSFIYVFLKMYARLKVCVFFLYTLDLILCLENIYFYIQIISQKFSVHIQLSNARAHVITFFYFHHKLPLNISMCSCTCVCLSKLINIIIIIFFETIIKILYFDIKAKIDPRARL